MHVSWFIAGIVTRRNLELWWPIGSCWLILILFSLICVHNSGFLLAAGLAAANPNFSHIFCPTFGGFSVLASRGFYPICRRIFAPSSEIFPNPRDTGYRWSTVGDILPTQIQGNQYIGHNNRDPIYWIQKMESDTMDTSYSMMHSDGNTFPWPTTHEPILISPSLLSF